MKKIIPVLFILAISGISNEVLAQAKKFVIFEHFTQASCAPCAQQNPVLQAVLDANIGRVHHIEYHTSWPGVDPMNAYNPTQVAQRVSYYNVGYVPDVFMVGNQYSGSPAGITQTMVDNAASESAPIRVIVKETSNGTVRTVKVTVFTVDTIPSATYKVRVGVVEKLITYSTPPGSNGEKIFHDVFRKMVPSTTGDTYTPAAIGDSATFTYTYALDMSTWDTTQIYSVAFIQNETTKGIVNSGSSIDPHWELVPLSHSFMKGIPGDTKTFNYHLINLGSNSENCRIKLTSVHPTDWSASFEIDGNTYMDSVDISVPGKTTLNLNLNVTIGDVAALGKNSISMQSLDNPQFAAQVLRSNLISGVYTLIINNNGGWGDGSSTTTSDFQQNYINGLIYAQSLSFAVTDMSAFEKGYQYDCMGDVLIYFFNVGWSFPSFTDKNVAIFSAELDAGKRLFVSGQDIGWDTWDLGNGGNGTTNTQAFYTNYLNAHWNADGGTSDNQLIANANDIVFGSIPTSPLINPYGGTNFYPDEINAIGIGTNIFYYNTAHTKMGGVRAANGTWKTVYLAPSLEMVGDSNVRKEIIKTSYIWFGGPLEGTENHPGIEKSYLGQNYPNPAGDKTTILMNGIDHSMTLEIVNITGSIVNTCQVNSGMTAITVSTTSFPDGLYLYRLINNGSILATKRMQIIH